MLIRCSACSAVTSIQQFRYLALIYEVHAHDISYDIIRSARAI
jgi:hypothetical protein